MKPLHPWNVKLEEAIRIQEELSDKVILEKTFSKVLRIGGGDVAYSKDNNQLIGAMVVLSYPEMETLDALTTQGKISFPYIPTFLSFREGPILINTFNKLRVKPDVMIFDGQGIAHPRGIGLASHMGLWLDLPSVGCAKTPLLGKYRLPGKLKGSIESIQRAGEKVGVVLRTKDEAKPIFVSPGHQIDLKTSIQIVLTSCLGFRIPEPLRRAHQLACSFRKG